MAHDLGRIPGGSNLERAQAFATGRAQAIAKATYARQQYAATTQLEAERNTRQNNVEIVSNARREAEHDAEVAEQAYAQAWANGDGLGVARAQRAMADADHRKRILTDGQEELEGDLAEVSPPSNVVYQRTPAGAYVARELPPPPQFSRNERIDRIQGLDRTEREYLKTHDINIDDPREVTRLQVAFNDGLRKGIPRGSPAWFEHFDDRMGFTPAPPDRKITLSPAQQEAARIAGVDFVTYARNVERQAEAKRLGMYP